MIEIDSHYSADKSRQLIPGVVSRTVPACPAAFVAG
jgi:hypothetical protein